MAFTIPSGRLRHVVTIQQRTDTPDEYGGSTQTYSDFAAGVRVEKKPLTGRQILAAKAVQSEAKVCFRFRAIAGLDATMRIVEGDTIYEIVGEPTDLLAEGRWTEVMTKVYGGGD